MKNGIDSELIRACASGDRRAQRRLFDESVPFLNMACHRYLRDPSATEDVLQETFAAIFASLGRFDEGRASFKTWATRIAINFCLKHNEKTRRSSATEELSPERHAAPVAPESLRNLSDGDLLDWLRSMPAPHWEVFSLCVIDGFSHDEVAAALGISVELSRQRLARGREWLRRNCTPEHRLLLEFSTN